MPHKASGGADASAPVLRPGPMREQRRGGVDGEGVDAVQEAEGWGRHRGGPQDRLQHAEQEDPTRPPALGGPQFAGERDEVNDLKTPRIARQNNPGRRRRHTIARRLGRE